MTSSYYQFSAEVRDAVAASDTRIVITGAGGWLGLATLELLQDALGPALVSRVRCFGASARSLALRSGVSISQRPLEELGGLEPCPTVLLHLAFLTKDRAEIMAEDEYRTANRVLSRRVLNSLDRIGITGVFVASSGAARFAEDPTRSEAMRLYGQLKRADEEEFAAWAHQAGKRAIITRIFNIAGPHINKVESYALSAFILAALAGDPVAVRAPHRVVRGYVAIRELMSLVFSLLLEPAPVVLRFDTGGDPMELEQVAAAVVAQLGGVATRAPLTSAADDVYVGERAAYDQLRADRGIPTVPFTEQVKETSRFLATTRRPFR